MSACEECWTEASRRVQLLGGSVVDRYQQVLTEAKERKQTPWHHTTTYEPTVSAEDQYWVERYGS